MGQPTQQDLHEAQGYFDLPSLSLVEKDWYVVQALAAITAADTAPFRLVFGGGTALSRAHRLTRRMSEDIDLRIVGETQSRGALRRLRNNVTQALLDAGFQFDPNNEAHRKVMHEGRYTRYQLPYEQDFAEEAGLVGLRPEIKIEMAMFPMRRPPVELQVISFIAEARKEPPELPKIACASIVETAAEKFVALTRRAGAELAGLREKHDPDLVRHVYDLHLIRDHYEAADFADLVPQIMAADVEMYGDRFPAYRADPLAETLGAIEGIAGSDNFANDYATFVQGMVYGDAPDFTTAVATLKALTEHLKRPV